MQAPTVGNLEALKRVARCLIGHGLTQEFATNRGTVSDSDHASCLRTHKSTSSSKVRSTSATQGVIALSARGSEFDALVKGTSPGLGAVLTLKDLGVDISKNTKIDKAVLEVRIDASAGRDIAERPLQPCGYKSSQKTSKSKSRISLEPRTRQISEPNILTKDQFEGHWKCVIVSFVKEGLESRCGQKCKKSRDPILKFSLSMMHAKLTRSQTRKWSQESFDDESSDAVKLKQLRDKMV